MFAKTLRVFLAKCQMAIFCTEIPYDVAVNVQKLVSQNKLLVKKKILIWHNANYLYGTHP